MSKNSKKTLLPLLLFACFFASGVFAVEMVDINKATIAQLDTLTGIGPVYAQRIIDGRPYSSVDDLDRVKGIGPATLQKIKTQGLACVNCSPTPTPAPAPAPLTKPAITYPSGVFINEILPNPQGADGTEEWIELYNSNGSDVDLSGWQLQDTVGTITTYTIPAGTKISAGGFLVLKRPETKIMLNNDQDGLNLLTPDKKIANSITFSSAPLGQSYNKTSGAPPGSWKWSTTLTPGLANIVPAATKTLPNEKISVKNNGVESGLADLSQTLPEGSANITNPWFLFFTALVITIILAMIVLAIKIKFKKHVRT